MVYKTLNNIPLNQLEKKDFDSFYNIVVKDIKSESNQEISDYLHSHLDLWLYVLQIIRRDIEVQLSCQKAKVEMHKKNSSDSSMIPQSSLSEYLDKQSNWRMSTVKFLSNIERKTLYVKFLIKSR